MGDKVLIMPGPSGMDVRVLQAAAGEFGCSVELVHNLSEAESAYSREHILALLFQREALGEDRSWVEAIRCLKFILPEVRLIACYGFAEPVDWEELSDVGAFHSLVLPLKDSEVRQSLGFMREAEKRAEEGVTVRLMAMPRASTEQPQAPAPKLLTRAAG